MSNSFDYSVFMKSDTNAEGVQFCFVNGSNKMLSYVKDMVKPNEAIIVPTFFCTCDEDAAYMSEFNVYVVINKDSAGSINLLTAFFNGETDFEDLRYYTVNGYVDRGTTCDKTPTEILEEATGNLVFSIIYFSSLPYDFDKRGYTTNELKNLNFEKGYMKDYYALFESLKAYGFTTALYIDPMQSDEGPHYMVANMGDGSEWGFETLITLMEGAKLPVSVKLKNILNTIETGNYDEDDMASRLSGVLIPIFAPRIIAVLLNIVNKLTERNCLDRVYYTKNVLDANTGKSVFSNDIKYTFKEQISLKIENRVGIVKPDFILRSMTYQELIEGYGGTLEKLYETSENIAEFIGCELEFEDAAAEDNAICARAKLGDLVLYSSSAETLKCVAKTLKKPIITVADLQKMQTAECYRHLSLYSERLSDKRFILINTSKEVYSSICDILHTFKFKIVVPKLQSFKTAVQPFTKVTDVWCVLNRIDKYYKTYPNATKWFKSAPDKEKMYVLNNLYNNSEMLSLGKDVYNYLFGSNRAEGYYSFDNPRSILERADANVLFTFKKMDASLDLNKINSYVEAVHNFEVNRKIDGIAIKPNNSNIFCAQLSINGNYFVDCKAGKQRVTFDLDNLIDANDTFKTSAPICYGIAKLAYDKGILTKSILKYFVENKILTVGLKLPQMQTEIPVVPVCVSSQCDPRNTNTLDFGISYVDILKVLGVAPNIPVFYCVGKEAHSDTTFYKLVDSNNNIGRIEHGVLRNSLINKKAFVTNMYVAGNGHLIYQE